MNEFALSAADVGSGLSKAASTLQLAGNSIQESAAMLTGITEVTQDPEKAGNALKILSLRIRGMKGELQELGEDVDENVVSLSKMQTQVLNLSHGKVNIFEDDGSFKSTYEIMQDIAKIYDDLTDTERADLLETIAGKNRANDVAALISNWEQVEKAMTAATNAEGTASQEQQKWSEHMQAALEKLSAAWQVLSNDIMNSDFLKGLVDAGTTTLEVLDSLVNTLGTLPTLLGTVAAAFSLKKNFGFFTTIDTQLTGLTNTIGLFGKSFSNIARDLQSGQGLMTSLFSKGITQNDVTCITNFMNQLKSGVPTGQAWANTMTGASAAGKQMAVSVKNGTVSLQSLTAAEGTSTIATTALRVGITLLNAAMTMGLALAIQAAITGLQHLVNAKKEAAESAQELAQKTKEEANEQNEEIKTLSELIAKYKELASSDTQDSTTRSEIKDIQGQITDLVGAQADNLDLVNGKLDEELAKLKEIEKKEAEKAVEKTTSAYHAAKKNSEAAIGEDSFLFIDGYAYTGKREKTAENILKDAGYTNNVQAGGFFGNTLFVMDEYDQNIQKLETAQEKAEFLQGMIDTLRQNYDDYASSDLYNSLVQQVEAYNKYSEAQTSAANDLLQAVTTASTYSDDIAKITVNSADTYEEYRQKLVDTVQKSPDLSEALKNKDISNDDIENYVNTYMSTLTQFSDFYDSWSEKYGEDNSELTAGVTSTMNAELTRARQLNELTQHFNEETKKWFEKLEDSDQDILYNVSLEVDDSASFTLEKWKEELEAVKETGKTTESSLQDFFDIMQDDTDGNFSSIIDSFQSDLDELQSAFDSISTGKLSDSEAFSLMEKFPILTQYADDLGTGIKVAMQGIVGSTDDAGSVMQIFDAKITEVGENTAAADALRTLRDEMLKLYSTAGDGFSFNIDAEIGHMDTVYDAIKDSISSTGLDTESIKGIKALYQGMEGYDASVLFEKTANGIHLNTKALRELEAQYESSKKDEFKNELKKLSDEYNDITKKINECDDATKKADLYAQRNSIADQIEDVSTLAAQYDGLTSAFKKWEEAQSLGEEGDMYDSLSSSLKNIKELFDEGLVGTNEFRAAVQLMSNEDLSTASVDELISAYESGYPMMKKFFTEGQDGCITFLKQVENLNSEWASMNSDGSWEINFGVGNDQEIADALGINVESVQAIMRKLSDYGFDINLDSMYSSLALLETDAEEANNKLIELGKTEVKFDFDTTSLDKVTSQIEEAQKLLDTFKSDDGTVDLSVEGATEAQSVLIGLITQKQSLTKPAVMSVDTSKAESDVNNIIGLLQSYQKDYNNIEIATAVGADTTEAQTNIQSVLSDIQSMPEDIKIALGLDDEDFTSTIESLKDTEIDVEAGVNLDTSALDTVQEKIAAITPEMMVKAGIDTEQIDNYKPNDGESTIIYKVDDKEVQSYKAPEKPGTVNYQPKLNDWTVPTLHGTIIYNKQISGGSNARGTAYSKGTAFSSGDWGTKNDGVALGGELGQELVVRDGKYFTIGDNETEFFKYKKGDIIFNAEQTRQIFSKGKITHGAKRGKSYAEGTAFSNGTGKFTKKGKVNLGNVSSDSDSKKNDSKAKTALEKFQEWFSKLFDWIEIKLERQADKIQKYVTRAENHTNNGSYDNAAKNYRKAIISTSTQISYEQTAASKYNKQGNKVLNKAVSSGIVSKKTADSIKKQVQNGSMNIKKYSERVQEVIKDYSTWYNKSQDAKDAITELHNKIRTYISDLKELRDAQRDAKLDSISTFSSIGTSGVANSTRAKNSQLNYTNSQLAQQNKAYDTEVTQVTSDTNAIGKKGTKVVKKALKSKDAKKNKKYKKALQNAQKAIKAKKPVASADLKTIKSKSISVYNNLYAYNLALENVETAKLEQAANYAATSAEVYKNIAEKYSNKDDATNSKISLLKQKSSNATSASKKNSLLAQAAAQYDTILKNDDAEIAEYSKAVASNRKTVTNKAGTTSKYKKLDSKTKKAVLNAIKAAKAAVKSKKSIPASTISSLAKYYSKGYVTKAFYEACVNYNDALESLELAEEQKELDVQEAIAEKAALGTEMVKNVEQEYTNKLNDNANTTRQIQTAQSVKTTRGLSLGASDYQSLINQSKKDQDLYSQAAAAISAQIQSNLANGYWTTDSQEYKDAIQTMNDYSNKAEECRVEQEEWNNAIAELPYSRLEKILDLLDAIKDNYKSLVSISTAKGLTETETQYLQEIANINAEIARYTELRTQAWADYQKALADADGVYGGKTADEWLAEYYNYDTSINNLTADVVELNNSIADLPYQNIEKLLDLLESIQSYNKSSVDLKSALGLDLSEADYTQQIKDNNDQIEQYQKERSQAYADYLKALANPEGVYGGKTANEWLAEYNKFGVSINELLEDNEKLKDSLRDDVYWRAFERAHDAAERFHKVLSGLSDLISNDMYFDSDGKLTEYGVAQVANLVSEYENARQEVQNYQADIANLNKLYAEGYYTEEEYTEKLNELQVSLLDSASSMKQFSDSIVNMYKDMAKSELDALMDLIDARNDALSAKKAYYEYDKTIKDRTKDIQTLEAEIAALQGVETAEAKAKRAMYEAQLAQAQEDLDNTIQEHIFDLSQDALNELKNTLQDAFDDKWDTINANLEELTSLMSAANNLSSSSAGTIISTMNKLLEHYGISPVSSGIQAAYASGTRRVPRNLTALTNEDNKNEILVTKQGMIAPLEQGDGVVPSYLTDRLYDLALNGVPMPNITVPEIKIPEPQNHPTEVNQHYDNLINIEGSADAATVEDLKSLSKDILEKSYAYTSQKIYKGYMHSGGKRNV